MNPHRRGGSGLSLRSRRRRRPFVEPLESRELLSTAAVYTVPTAVAGPRGITSGPDGNLWFTEYNASKIGMINPTTYVMYEFPTPTGDSGPVGITSGPDGNLWFTEVNADKIGMISPTKHVVSEFPIPSDPFRISRNSEPTGITAGRDGKLWFTQSASGQIGTIDPTTHAIDEFSIPTDGSPSADITSGSDGNLWFTESGANRIGTIDPTTHAIREFAVPVAGASPQGITTGPDGSLWFTEAQGDQIGTINPKTDVITIFSLPTPNSDPSSITAGPDGNLWFTELAANQIGIINPTDHSITEVPVLPNNPEPVGVTAGPDGNIWLTEFQSSSIAVFTPTDLVVTAEPPSSVVAGVPFGLTVSLSSVEGQVDTGYNGPITLSLVSNAPGATLGGTLTVAAHDGVATFSGLTIDRGGSYLIKASASPLIAVLTTQMAVLTPTPTVVGVPPPTGAQQTLFDPPPTIVAEKVLFYRRLRGRPRRVRGFELDFSQAMDAADAGQASNYTMTQILESHRRRFSVPVDLGAAYDATAHSVTLTPVGHPTFPHGARLVVIARRPPAVINVFPDGIADAKGVSLDGDNRGVPGDDGNFVIAPKGSAISR